MRQPGRNRKKSLDLSNCQILNMIYELRKLLEHFWKSRVFLKMQPDCFYWHCVSNLEI